MTDWKLKSEAFLCALSDAPLGNGEGSGEALNRLLKDLGLNGDRHAVSEACGLASGAAIPRAEECGGQGLILAHPLLGTRSSIDSAPVLGSAQTASLVGVLQEAVNGGGPADREKRRFLALWRLLPDLLAQQNPLWSVLPADPQHPGRSLWDHAATASAIAGTHRGNALQPAILVFTVASAQEFVTAARRTQDSWMGSFLFSYLMWAAMQPVVCAVGPDAVLNPDLHGQPLVDRWLFHNVGLKHRIIERSAQDPDRLKIANVPNVFTAIVPFEEASTLAGSAEQALHDAKRGIGERVKAFVEEGIDQALKDGTKITLHDPRRQPRWEDAWTRQIEELLRANVFWTAYPWRAGALTARDRLVGPRPQPVGSGMAWAYPAASELAWKMLTARKNLRAFNQVPEPDHKCSQCGLREALSPAPQDADPYAELARFWDALQRVGEKAPEPDERKRKLCGRVRRGDRLCSVCLTKRLAWEAYFLNPDAKGDEGGLNDAFPHGCNTLPGHLLFPSTASIATAPFKERILNELKRADVQPLRGALEEYVKAVETFLGVKHRFFPSAAIPRLERLAASLGACDPGLDGVIKTLLRLDGDWLYEESFDAQSFEREYAVKLSNGDRDGRQRAQAALRQLVFEARELGIPKPRRYYAVLAMDGDKMGDWLAGGLSSAAQSEENAAGTLESAGSSRRDVGPAYHRALSRALKEFALELVRPVVEDRHGGKLVYAGGDDVLALLPLDGLLGAMRDLRRLYAGVPGDVTLADARTVMVDASGVAIVREGGSGQEHEVRRLFLPGAHDPCLPQAHRVTISAGAAVAHVTHPFWHVVEEASDALKNDAKGGDRGDRDAWSIRVLKRSGEPQHSFGKWSYSRNGQEFDVLDNLDAVARLFRSGLSPRFLYHMRAAAPGMEDLSVTALRSELARMLSRREGLSDRDGLKLKDLDIPGWFECLGGSRASTGGSGTTGLWHRVMHWLYLAQFLARGQDGG